MKGITNHYRVPAPPQELRKNALNAARKEFQKREQKQHHLLFSWAFVVALLVLFLIFWNPPIPASSIELSGNSRGFISDPLLQRLYDQRHSDESKIAQTTTMKILLQERI